MEQSTYTGIIWPLQQSCWVFSYYYKHRLVTICVARVLIWVEGICSCFYIYIYIFRTLSTVSGVWLWRFTHAIQLISCLLVINFMHVESLNKLINKLCYKILHVFQSADRAVPDDYLPPLIGSTFCRLFNKKHNPKATRDAVYQCVSFCAFKFEHNVIFDCDELSCIKRY